MKEAATRKIVCQIKMKNILVQPTKATKEVNRVSREKMRKIESIRGSS
jgi:hypothetical protein